MTRWRVARLIMFGAAVCFMAVLIARLGPREILGQLRAAGPGALWLLVVYAVGTSIGAIPWYLLMPSASRPRRRDAVASRFAASGANALLPLMGFGGEPVRLLWLGKRNRAAGIAAIVVDRLIYAVASVLFLFAGVFAVTQLAQVPRSYVLAALIGGFVLLLFNVIAIWLVSRGRIAGWIHRIIRKLRGRAAPGAGELGPLVDDRIAEIASHRRRVVWSLLLHLVGRVLIGAEVCVGFMVLDVPLPWDAALVFATVPILLALVGAVVPSQIGIQESTQALIATMLGISPVTAVAVVLLQRIRQLVTGSIAWLLISTVRGSATSSGPPEAASRRETSAAAEAR